MAALLLVSSVMCLMFVQNLDSLKITDATADIVEYDSQVLGQTRHYVFAVYNIHFDSDIYFTKAAGKISTTIATTKAITIPRTTSRQISRSSSAIINGTTIVHTTYVLSSAAFNTSSTGVTPRSNISYNFTTYLISSNVSYNTTSLTDQTNIASTSPQTTSPAIVAGPPYGSQMVSTSLLLLTSVPSIYNDTSPYLLPVQTSTGLPLSNTSIRIPDITLTLFQLSTSPSMITTTIPYGSYPSLFYNLSNSTNMTFLNSTNNSAIKLIETSALFNSSNIGTTANLSFTSMPVATSATFSFNSNLNTTNYTTTSTSNQNNTGSNLSALGSCVPMVNRSTSSNINGSNSSIPFCFENHTELVANNQSANVTNTSSNASSNPTSRRNENTAGIGRIGFSEIDSSYSVIRSRGAHRNLLAVNQPISLVSFNRTGIDGNPEIFNLTKVLGSVRLKISCKSGVKYLNSSENLLLVTRPVKNPLSDVLQRVPGLDVPKNIQIEPDQTWQRGLLSLVQLISITSLFEESGKTVVNVSEIWTCADSSADTLGEIEINYASADGDYAFSDSKGNLALGQVIPIRRSQYNCTSTDVINSFRVFEASVNDATTSFGTNQFNQALSDLRLVQLSWGAVSCHGFLHSLVNLTEESAAIHGSRACMLVPNTAKWLKDPCCNPSLLLEQCCPARNVSLTSVVVNTPLQSMQGKCNMNWQAKIQNSLLSISQISALQNDPYAGCTPARQLQASKMTYDRLYAFYQTCAYILTTNRTKLGLSSCVDDIQCYTACQNGTCVPPSVRQFGNAFLLCAIEYMDLQLLDFFIAQQGMWGNFSFDDLVSKVSEERGTFQCVGPSANESNSFHGSDQSDCEASMLCSDGEITCKDRQDNYFCELCISDGLQSESIIVPARCYARNLNPVLNCSEEDALAFKTDDNYLDDLGHVCLLEVDPWDTNGSSCFDDTLCQDDRDLCLRFDVCYVADVNESECEDVERFNNSWPIWITGNGSLDKSMLKRLFPTDNSTNRTTTEVFFERSIISDFSHLYIGNGICLMGVLDIQEQARRPRVAGAGDYNCSGNPNSTFSPARIFQAAMFANKSSCEQPLCSLNESKEIPILASACAGAAGSCNTFCGQCQSMHNYENGLDDISHNSDQHVCIGSETVNFSVCTAYHGIWNESFDLCLYRSTNLTQTFQCPDNFVSLSCGQLSLENCSAGSGQSNFSTLVSETLLCFWNENSPCVDMEECESSGWCNDKAYQIADVVCRIPWTKGTNGDIVELSGCITRNPAVVSPTVLGDACVLSNISEAECARRGGMVTSKARTKEECEDSKACFYNGYQITKLTENQCQSSCDNTLYQWRSLYSWTFGSWTEQKPLQGVWKQKKMIPKNHWIKILSEADVELLSQQIVIDFLKYAYISEAMCIVNPWLNVFQTLSCGCSAQSSMSTDGQFQCGNILANISQSTIAEFRMSPGTPATFRSRFANIIAAGSILSPQSLSILSINFIAASDLRSPASSNPSPSRPDCSMFERVVDARNSIIGQVIGNGFFMNSGASIRANICTTTDTSIDQCPQEYPITDLGSFSGALVRPLVDYKLTQISPVGQICAVLNTSGSSSFVPILRQLYVMQTGSIPMMNTTSVEAPIIEVTVSLGLQSKDDFNPSIRSAFRSAMASSLGTPAEDIRISKVCDDSGCGTRRASGGTTVTTQIQSSTNTMGILSQVNSGDFGAKLGSALNATLVAMGLPQISVTFLGVTVVSNYAATTTVTAGAAAITNNDIVTTSYNVGQVGQTSIVANVDFSETMIQAVGNLSLSLELARSIWRPVVVSSQEFQALWRKALVLALGSSVPGGAAVASVPFFAAPGVLLQTQIGVNYSDSFAMDINTQLNNQLSSVSCALVMGNVTSAASISVSLYPIVKKRRGLCPSNTEWRLTKDSNADYMSCACPANSQCSDETVCAIVPASGQWFVRAFSTDLCTPSIDNVQLVLGIGLGIGLPLVTFITTLAFYCLRIRRRLPKSIGHGVDTQAQLVFVDDKGTLTPAPSKEESTFSHSFQSKA